jgi:hypothetical protein
VHLGEIAVVILGLAARDPLGSWPWNTVSVVTMSMITVAGITVRGRHDFPPCLDSLTADYTLPNEVERHNSAIDFGVVPDECPGGRAARTG